MKLKNALLILCYMLIIAGFATALYLLKPLLLFVWRIALPFLVAFILAYIFNPLLSWFQRRLHISRIIALVIFYFLVTLVISFFLVIIIPPAYVELRKFVELLVREIPEAINWVATQIKVTLTAEQLEQLRTQLQQVHANLESLLRSALPGLGKVATGGFEAAQAVARGVIAGVSALVATISFWVFVLVINFYLLVDFHHLRPIAEHFFPIGREERVSDVLHKVDRAVGGFIRGQVIDAALIGVLVGIMLFIFGFREYALLIGLISGVTNFIPYFGPIIGASAAYLWLFISPDFEPSFKLYGILIVAGIFIFVQAVEGFVFQPRIVGRGAQLHPLLVLLALMVGGYFGLAGLILAVPAMCIVRVLIKELVWLPYLERRKQLTQRESVSE